MEHCGKEKEIDKLVEAVADRQASETGFKVALQHLSDKLDSIEEKFTSKFEEIIGKQDTDRELLNKHDRIIFAIKWIAIGGAGFAVAQKIGITEFIIKIFS